MFPRNIFEIALCALLGACVDTSCPVTATADPMPCASTSSAIQYTNVPGHNDAIHAETSRVVPVRIDRNFTFYERAKILQAVNEWNHVLNGYVRLDLSPDALDVAGLLSTRRLPAEGWAVAKVDSRYPAVSSSAMKRTLGLTIWGRTAMVLVVADRVGSGDLGGIVMHEFGHALGAHYDPDSRLMHPYFTGNMQSCIDKGAARAVALAQGLPLANLNWCGQLVARAR